MVLVSDEALATPQIGDVPLRRGEHGDMIGKPFFDGRNSAINIAGGFDRFFHSAQTKRQ
jgi:hypothetical protein